jgi:NAD(P)-dependent dehydrogenase (short-subunit alcohol dehydrogenase family)
MNLEGKVAILTGACGGIGRAIVSKLVAEGARVLATDLSEEQLSALQEEFGEPVAVLSVDVTDHVQVDAMVAFAAQHFGRLDIMINNAGIGFPKPLLDHDPSQDFERETAVNQKGVYYGILAAARQFRAQGIAGVILNTSSVYGQMAAEMTFSYNVSKAAVDMMTKCAALELAPHKIRVCAVAPGRVDTPLLHQYKELGLWDHIRREQMRETFTRPAEIANVVAFLASDAASCINGCTVNADDGFASFKYPLLNH